MLSKKKTLLLIASSVILLIAAILIAVIVPQAILKAGGTVNQDSIFVVDGINDAEQIVIPVKMKNGYSTPSHQVFNSSLTLKELCELAAKNDALIKYEINGSSAYLYKEKSGQIVARAALHRNNSNGYLNYVLENMYVKGIIFPTHLTEMFVHETISLNGTEYDWYAVSFMTIEELTAWLKGVGIYTIEVNEQNDTLVCRYEKQGKTNQNTIHYDGNLIAIK